MYLKSKNSLKISNTICINSYKNKIHLIQLKGLIGDVYIVIPFFIRIGIHKKSFIFYLIAFYFFNKKKNNFFYKFNKFYIYTILKNLYFFFSNVNSKISLGYNYILDLRGVGYKFFYLKNSRKLGLKLGYSHKNYFMFPEQVFSRRISRNRLKLFSPSKFLLSDIAMKLKNLKKVEIYKGKGLRFFKEVIMLKQGKREN